MSGELCTGDSTAAAPDTSTRPVNGGGPTLAALLLRTDGRLERRERSNPETPENLQVSALERAERG